jgi:hypothetical protein
LAHWPLAQMLPPQHACMLPPQASQVWLLSHWYGAPHSPPRQQRSPLPPQATQVPLLSTVFGAVQRMSGRQAGWPRRPQVPQPPVLQVPDIGHIEPDATHWPVS